ncbi:unnamed protein product [Fusarium langsethiae]|nr:unnamed protein product [Fusarium langsethiae]
MKAVIFALASVAISVLAAPFENDAAKQLESRDNCDHVSHCSEDWVGQAERYCEGHDLKFSHMFDDCWVPFERKVCCEKPSV